jgi:hypothetical protein
MAAVTNVVQAPIAHAEAFSAHAEGVQIYECRAYSATVYQWILREPVASLIIGENTVGHHYGGPSWGLEDGSIVKGQVIEASPGATANDIPHLKLKVVARQGHGILTPVRFVYRVRTHGGVLKGVCKIPGSFRSVAYSADYIFTK